LRTRAVISPTRRISRPERLSGCSAVGSVTEVRDREGRQGGAEIQLALLNGSQIVGDLTGVLVALLRLLGERLVEYGLQTGQ
jgi:hypothetical protein